MPGGFPLDKVFANAQSVGAVLTTTDGTVVTSGAANTKGSYTQLIASTAADAVAIYAIFDTFNSSTSDEALFDFAVGASGSEVPFLNNVPWGAAQAPGGVLYPCTIPAGSRLSVRFQSAAAATTYPVYATLFDGDLTTSDGAAGADGIGFSLTTSLGTLITASATANSKGSYAQLIASTTRDYAGFYVHGESDNTQVTSVALFMVDVAIGASGSEVVIVPNIQMIADPAVGEIATPLSPFFPIPIPAGTRVAMRCQSSVASKTFSGAIVGVYQ